MQLGFFFFLQKKMLYFFRMPYFPTFFVCLLATEMQQRVGHPEITAAGAPWIANWTGRVDLTDGELAPGACDLQQASRSGSRLTPHWRRRHDELRWQPPNMSAAAARMIKSKRPILGHCTFHREIHK